MSCEKTTKLLDDYVDGMLSGQQLEDVKQHCQTCENCALNLKALIMQKQVISSLPVPAASNDFNENVIARAIQQAEPGQSVSNRHARFYKFATVAMISALVIWAGFFVEQQQDEALYHVAVGDEVRTIKVAIESAQALDSVKMHIELSDNLELAGFGNKKQINWSTGLRKGVNVISLPIVGIAQGRGDVTTRIQLNGKEKVMRINTLYESPGSVLYENNRMLQG